MGGRDYVRVFTAPRRQGVGLRENGISEGSNLSVNLHTLSEVYVRDCVRKIPGNERAYVAEKPVLSSDRKYMVFRLENVCRTVEWMFSTARHLTQGGFLNSKDGYIFDSTSRTSTHGTIYTLSVPLTSGTPATGASVTGIIGSVILPVSWQGSLRSSIFFACSLSVCLYLLSVEWYGHEPPFRDVIGSLFMN